MEKKIYKISTLSFILSETRKDVSLSQDFFPRQQGKGRGNVVCLIF